MGAGRKAQTFLYDTSLSLQHESPSTWSRNLNKSQLGGVIFGCKNNTIKECLSKQLFGLPGQHFLYVKNIVLGLPLFLFNYSDRKLHGIFEAASCGQMDIDPYAWTSGGAQKTPFSAQVQIRSRLHCQPLPEDQFKQIIVDNYYNCSHFWFELDHVQASKLISKFSSLAVSARTYGPSAESWSTVFQALPSEDKRGKTDASDSPALIGDSAIYQEWREEEDSLDVSMQLNTNKPQEKSIDGRETAKDEREFLFSKLKELVLIRGCPDATANKNKVEIASIDDSTSNDETSAGTQTDLGKEDGSSLDTSSNVVEQLLHEVEELKAFKREQTQRVYTLEKKLEEAEREIQRLKSGRIILESKSADHVETAADSFENIHIEPGESLFLVGGYNGEQWLSTLDLYSPYSDVVKSLKPMHFIRSYASVAKLNGELYAFGGGDGSLWYDTVEAYNPDQDHWRLCPSLSRKKGSLAGVTWTDKIFALGGGDGIECFSNVDMFDAHVGRWIPVQSMLQRRFALASVELNGAIYSVGGYDGNDYLRCGERYDPREHSWTRIANMSTARGGHSMVVMDEKLYALGGYNGMEMVPSIEIYDPRRGTWMIGEPMNQPRGYLAAAVLRDYIYAIGGVKSGEDLADTVECYKEGKGWQTTDLKAIGSRCFSSAIALGED